MCIFGISRSVYVTHIYRVAEICECTSHIYIVDNFQSMRRFYINQPLIGVVDADAFKFLEFRIFFSADFQFLLTLSDFMTTANSTFSLYLIFRI